MHRLPRPAYGDIWIVRLDPVIGHEQGGTRPAVVVSDDRLNRSRAELVYVAPMTRTVRPVPWHVRLGPPDVLPGEASVVLCDAVRSISLHRLQTPVGHLSEQALSQITQWLMLLLKISVPRR
jgi:mRNA interferase MazF